MEDMVSVNREHLDFSLDSRIRESLLAEIKAHHLCRLEDDALYCVNAAGDPAEQNKPRDINILDDGKDR